MVSKGAGGRAEKPHATGEVRERNSRWASVCASKATAARMPDCLEPTPLMGAVVAGLYSLLDEWRRLQLAS